MTSLRRQMDIWCIRVMASFIVYRPCFNETIDVYPIFREVCQSLKTAQSLYAQWSAQLERPGGSSDGVQLHTITTELKNCLKSIEWDLQDLGQTISILFCYLYMLGIMPQKWRLSWVCSLN